MEQVKERRNIRRAFHILMLLLLAAVFGVLSSDAIHGRWAFYVPKTITVNGESVVVNDELRRNEYTEEDFAIGEDGRMVFRAGNYRTGIDVSSHQGKINWKKVAKDGIGFAIIRAGFRGYSQEGSLNQDERFRKNARAARKNGLEIGAYFFSQATSVKEAQEEADFLLEQLEGLDITLPVVFDWEVIAQEASGEEGARTDEVDQATVTACALAFCQRIEAAGYQPAIYCNNHTGYFALDLAQLQSYPIWYASYDKSWPDYYYGLDLWQYTDTGTVDGITGNVDLNIYPIATDPADGGGDGGASGSASASSASA